MLVKTEFRIRHAKALSTIEGRKCLFNDAFSTFYLRLTVVKEHSNSKTGNLQPPLHGLFFPISTKGSFYAPSHRRDIQYHDLIRPVVEHWLELEIA